jgi:hypothetical protein
LRQRSAMQSLQPQVSEYARCPSDGRAIRFSRAS